MAPSDANTTAPGGAGGGAIQLSSRMAISITGTIVAGGAGGEGSPLNAAVGGGGGGAGGYIGFDSGSLAIDAGAIVAANGGGGGAKLCVHDHGKPGHRRRRERVSRTRWPRSDMRERRR